MKGNNFHHMAVAGQAIAPQSMNESSTVNGVAVDEPWKTGRQLVFFFDVGATVSGGTVTVEVQQRSDDAWVALKEHTSQGTADVNFTFSGTDDNTSYLATVLLHRVDSTTYKAVRLSITTGASVGANLIGASYAIVDGVRTPSGQADQTFAQQVPA